MIANLEEKPIEQTFDFDISKLPVGRDKERLVKTRVNQDFFRSSVLGLYQFKCCITGLNIPELLVASHIKPWKDDFENRTNPQNGLCLNTLHDKAFDKGYITITTEYRVKTSKHLDDFNSKANEELFIKYENFPIDLPEKFLPKKEFLEYHYEEVFKK